MPLVWDNRNTLHLQNFTSPTRGLTKHIFLYVWIYSWPVVINFCFLLLMIFTWHVQWLLATTYGIPAPQVRLYAELHCPSLDGSKALAMWANCPGSGCHMTRQMGSGQPRGPTAGEQNTEPVRPDDPRGVLRASLPLPAETWQHDPAPTVRDFMLCKS